VLQFGESMKISNRLASELDFWKNRVLSEEFMKKCWDRKVAEAWQKDFQW
jgi:hypothetical protein